MNPLQNRDHGGDLAAAMALYGGAKDDWIDLSTGINPQPYPLAELDGHDWQALPGRTANARLEKAARDFWQIPDGAGVLAAPGASALIARIPALRPPATVTIPGPTYNEHAAAFAGAGWRIADSAGDALVVVHPNNPDGRLWQGAPDGKRLTIIDESFCEVTLRHSYVNLSDRPNTLVLKSFGKFWGLAGLRLGFAIGAPDLVAALAASLGPWPVSGPALTIGAAALGDPDWTHRTRARLNRDAARLDRLMSRAGARTVGGTSLFRLYDVDDAAAWQSRLARAYIWSRIFPYSDRWLRLGLPPADRWQQLEAAL
jgi:cobalamin biosynthesis protein CobC